MAKKIPTDLHNATNAFTEALTNNQDKIHLNLSDFAWNIIFDDLAAFMDTESKSCLSDLINIIFLNYHEDSPANLSEQIKSKAEELYHIFNIHPDEKDLISYAKQLYEKQSRFPKGYHNKGKKITVNSAVYDILDSLSDDDYVIKFYRNKDGSKGKPGAYFKAVVENYCLLPFCEREKIICKDIYTKLHNAIAHSEDVTITLKSGAKFSLHPYKILEDPISSFTYVVGSAKPLFAAEKYRVISFRLSRIEKLTIDKRSPYNKLFIPDDEIDRCIAERGIQFLAGECITAKVQFTEQGLKNYNNFLNLRPRKLPETPEEKKQRIYTFEATSLQLEAYFFKFGPDAIILEPEELRNKFILKYTDALNAYKE